LFNLLLGFSAKIVPGVKRLLRFASEPH
jgi:hypothetical protein